LFGDVDVVGRFGCRLLGARPAWTTKAATVELTRTARLSTDRPARMPNILLDQMAPAVRQYCR
jgi:hypothetical protein